MPEKVTLTFEDNRTLDFNCYQGSYGNKAIDISTLRANSGYTTFDNGFANTAPSQSNITFLNGEQGILQYRGYSIEDLCTKADFLQVSYLLINGNLPNEEEYKTFQNNIKEFDTLHPTLINIIQSLPQETHPMAIVSIALNSLCGIYPKYCSLEKESIDKATYVLLGQMPNIVAAAYLRGQGKEFKQYPYSSCAEQLLKTMFKNDSLNEDVISIMDKLLSLHGDHEFNCSTSTVRLVGSSHANLFSSVSAGVCALWGPLHGGANQKVLEMLEQIHQDGNDYEKYIKMAKDKSSNFRLMGFGHRVYKNYDPRAKIIKKTCKELLQKIGSNDPLLQLAQNLEKKVLEDEYFIQRKLYPNVDFYSGLIYKSLNIPANMFTPLFALGRMPGWIAHWQEQHFDKNTRIGRPRQFYSGQTQRSI